MGRHYCEPSLNQAQNSILIRMLLAPFYRNCRPRRQDYKSISVLGRMTVTTTPKNQQLSFDVWPTPHSREKLTSDYIILSKLHSVQNASYSGWIRLTSTLSSMNQLHVGSSTLSTSTPLHLGALAPSFVLIEETIPILRPHHYLRLMQTKPGVPSNVILHDDLINAAGHPLLIAPVGQPIMLHAYTKNMVVLLQLLRQSAPRSSAGMAHYYGFRKSRLISSSI